MRSQASTPSSSSSRTTSMDGRCGATLYFCFVPFQPFSACAGRFDHRSTPDAGPPARFFPPFVIQPLPEIPARQTARRRFARTAFWQGAIAFSMFLVGCVPAVPIAPTVQPTVRGESLWRVEPGDVIRLRTWLTVDQSGDLPVNERGQVLVPNVGRLTVIGLAPGAVEAQIIRAYAGRLDSSRVEVTFLRPVSVVGGGKSPGVQLPDPSPAVLSLISRAAWPI